MVRSEASEGAGGTPGYEPPEVILGEKLLTICHFTDLISFRPVMVFPPRCLVRRHVPTPFVRRLHGKHL